MQSTLDLTGYDAARETVVFYRVPEPGYLRVRGDDRIAFIQRQTTNDIRALTPERTQMTVLTSATARILDVWQLVMEPESIGVITLPGRGAITARYLQTRIFFMDKVAVEDARAALGQFDVWGPQAASLLKQIGVESIPSASETASISAADVPARIIGLPGFIARGWRLILPAEQMNSLAAQLSAAGATPLSQDAHELLRVEEGLPGPAHELTDQYTPLETNLDAVISSTKGCYTGQEIIARQITYDKITRRMVGLRLEGPVSVGAEVLAENRKVGEVTSAVESPRLGSIALAVIRRPHHEPGTTIVVKEGEHVINGVMSALPFDQSQIRK